MKKIKYFLGVVLMLAGFVLAVCDSSQLMYQLLAMVVGALLMTCGYYMTKPLLEEDEKVSRSSVKSQGHPGSQNIL